MNQKIVILKHSDTKISVFDEYITVKNIYHDIVISFSHIEMIYINKSIDINIATCYKLTKKVPLYIIDNHGYIIAEFKRSEDEKI